MKILITGAAGQLGSYLAEHLSKRHEVTALDIVRAEHDLGRSEFVLGDVKDYRLAMDLCKGVDAIVHAAAQVSVDRSVTDPVFDAKENILGTLNMLETATKTMVGHFIYISSAAIFGEPVNVPLDEEHPTRPLSPYGVSKLAGENYSFAFQETYGLPVTAIRPFNIYSPRQDPDSPYSGVITRFIDRMAKGEKLMIHGDGAQTRDFVSAHDVVRLVETCLEDPKAQGQRFNCGTGIGTSVKELAELVIRLSGKDVGMEHADQRKGDIKHSCADITKATELLDYQPKIKLEEGLAELI